MAEEYSTIPVFASTKERLDTFKLVPTETYDHLVNRLLSEMEGKKSKRGGA